MNFLGSRPFFYSDRVSRADLAVHSFLFNLPEAAGPEVGAQVDQRELLRQHLDRVSQVLTGASPTRA